MEKLILLTENSSLPGVSIVINCKRRIVKIIWFLSIISLSIVCMFIITELAQNYLKNQEVIDSQTYSENRSEFPAVTFCTPVDQTFFAYLLNVTVLEKNVSLNLSEPLINCFFDGLPCNWTDFAFDFAGLFLKNPHACYRFNSGLNATGQQVSKKKKNFKQ